MLAHVLAFGLLLFYAGVSGTPVPDVVTPHYFHRNPITRRDLSVHRVQVELGKLLSNGSVIFGPKDPAYPDAVRRWNTRSEGDVEVVVVPKQESDVSKIVVYCNQNSINFLTVGRGNGMSISVATFKGLQIDLSELTGITLQPHGKSAWFQGGNYGLTVIRRLWDAGYVTATGSNECIGLLGAGLGGGLGRYMGLHGLVVDNFRNLNVVLADGSQVTVNEKNHGDLFWGMKGAGANFGIVTSVELNIYPREIETWHYHNYTWTQDQLETVFEELARFHGNGTTPPKMGVNFGQISIVPEISKTEPVLVWTWGYAGPADEAEKLLAPFNKIPAIASTSGDVSYPDLLRFQSTAIDQTPCQPEPFIGAESAIRTYNVTTQRQIYNLMLEVMTAHPELAPGMLAYYEGYATKAVQAIDPATAAFPHRDENFFVYVLGVAPEGSEQIVRDWAAKSRAIWNAGEPGRRPSTYVNHAGGDETLQAIYGYEPWRLAKLRALKAKYDPHNRFRFFNPIIRN